MATLAEIGNAYAEPSDGALFRRFLGQCIESAGTIMAESVETPNHANRLIWANAILSDDQEAVYRRVRQMKNYALATNADVRYSPENCLDSAIASAVAAGLEVFATGN